ncbi:uncharacterized protein BYT42DRAFT_605945, partial [Radiomyces spectabilis]|uniref:uncharacterized protein n=1 Tax=Radiomyces spectabilis TaxID=64574 RepID=UPI00222001A2
MQSLEEFLKEMNLPLPPKPKSARDFERPMSPLPRRTHDFRTFSCTLTPPGWHEPSSHLHRVHKERRRQRALEIRRMVEVRQQALPTPSSSPVRLPAHSPGPMIMSVPETRRLPSSVSPARSPSSSSSFPSSSAWSSPSSSYSPFLSSVPFVSSTLVSSSSPSPSSSLPRPGPRPRPPSGPRPGPRPQKKP